MAAHVVRREGAGIGHVSAAVHRSIGRAGLRVLAYHGIPDADAFDRQMRYLRTHYEPVDTDQVIAAFAGGPPLPSRSVWVTFDDGLPSVVERGQEVLDRHDIRAALFVCPGLIVDDTANWWDVVQAATVAGVPVPHSLRGLSATEATTFLKGVPDDARRAAIGEITQSLRACGSLPRATQLTEAQLEGWTRAGHHLGNHSWDHPCLDRCSPEQQEDQVTRADQWLRARFPHGPRIFAYPNGNATETVERVLEQLGYDLALLFDHRVARPGSNPMRVSRLRVSTTASSDRFAAIVSGAHSIGYHAKRLLTRATDPSSPQRPATATTSPIDDHNHTVYELPRVVERFASDHHLMPCEEHVFGEYVHPGAAVLDLGVGAGRTTPRLSAGARRYVGIDYSMSMIEAARASHPGADLRLADASDLSAFADSSFDVVVFSFNGLDYLHPYVKREQCVVEMSRVVRSDGIVIVSDHNARALVRPRPKDTTLFRALAIQGYASARLVARTLPSRALRAGEGFVHDSASSHVNYATTPARIVAEFHRQGLDLRESVGSRFPNRLPDWMEPWHYFVFQKTNK